MWCRFNVLVCVENKEPINSNLMPNRIIEDETEVSTTIINMDDIIRYYKSYDKLDGIKVEGTGVVLPNDDFLFLLIGEKEFTTIFEKSRNIEVINYVK